MTKKTSQKLQCCPSLKVIGRFLLAPSVCQLAGVTSHSSHIYKGINAMLIIRGPIKPSIFWIKIILAIFLAKTRPDKTIFSALTNLTIDFDLNYQKYKCWIRTVYFVLFMLSSHFFTSSYYNMNISIPKTLKISIPKTFVKSFMFAVLKNFLVHQLLQLLYICM